MKEILKKYAYTFSGSCHCDGFLLEKYTKDDYQVRASERRAIFKIKKGGRSITQWIPLPKLEETLKSIHAVAVQA